MTTEEKPALHTRRIRSFVRRPGRLTVGQRNAFDDLWPRFGVNENESIDWPELFGRASVPRVLEIGYGDGDSLISLAESKPDTDFLGIEVHEPGVGHCLIQIDKLGLKNVRLIRVDAIDVLGKIEASSLDRLNLYFPDPWPKKRHHKRRIVNAAFLSLASAALKAEGQLHIATDWSPYAEYISETLSESKLFNLHAHELHDGESPLARFTTKFERRGLKLGHRINDWIYSNSKSGT